MQYNIERNTVTKGRKQTGTTNTEWLYHRRRIKTEAKAKVIASQILFNSLPL